MSFKSPVKPCRLHPGLCLDGLFACRVLNDCACTTDDSVVDVDPAKVAEFCDLNRSMPADLEFPDGCTQEQQTYLTVWWKHLTDAYKSLYGRTCKRFHACDLTVRLCFPACPPCPPCDKCRTPICFPVPELACLFTGDGLAVESVTFTMWDSDGTRTEHAVNVPNTAPIPGARWKLTADGQLCGLKTGGTYPQWPTQDVSAAPGEPDTHVLVVEFCHDVDPDFTAAVYEQAQLNGTRCTPTSKCDLGSNVTSATDDGVTLQFESETPATPNGEFAASWQAIGFTNNQIIDNALIRWRCAEGVAEFACDPCGTTSLLVDWWWT